MAVTGLSITPLTILRKTSPSAPGALLVAPDTSARVICAGKMKLATTATIAANSVVSRYKDITVRNRLPSPVRAVATEEITRTATNTGATALSAPTKRSPNNDITPTPGIVNAKTEPTIIPARIRNIRFVCCHFLRVVITTPFIYIQLVYKYCTLSYLNILFSAILNGSIYVIQEGFSALEHLQNIFHIQIGIIIVSRKAEILQFDVFDIRSISIESQRSTLKFLVLVKRKRRMQTFDYPLEITSSKLDILATIS
jgi:hypothetical protein